MLCVGVRSSWAAILTNSSFALSATRSFFIYSSLRLSASFSFSYSSVCFHNVSKMVTNDITFGWLVEYIAEPTASVNFCFVSFFNSTISEYFSSTTSIFIGASKGDSIRLTSILFFWLRLSISFFALLNDGVIILIFTFLFEASIKDCINSSFSSLRKTVDVVRISIISVTLDFKTSK